MNRINRYSKSAVTKSLAEWIVSVYDNGLYSRHRNSDTHLDQVDAGMIASAQSLLDDIKLIGHKKLLKSDFKRLVELRWEVACTLPANKHLFSERTGYSQVRGKSREICFDYGKWNFDVNLVYSLFSEIL